jgi:uncharacterized repeat protein (TIGR03806 family)
MRRALFCVLAALALCVSATAQPAPEPVNQRVLMATRAPEMLAAYRLFTDAGARTANAGVTPYDLNTPLWSDGALKFRYLYLPPGTRATYREDGVFDLPVGAVLIKTFAIAPDMRRPSENVRFIETRLLIHRRDGWVALPYVWNEAQTEARLSTIGAAAPVQFTDAEGRAAAFEWSVPNTNQCKGCHDLSGEIVPIGPNARNLNRTRDYGDGPENQLAHWRAAGLIDQAPADAPRAADAYNSASGTLEQRARAYLDVNCAHCHNPQGPAHTSGLDLRSATRAPVAWGVGKRPTAAGRGSAGMQFAIAPGEPDQSFLLHRMQTNDPGEMMPELGRTIRDDRAIALIRDWIAGMGPDGRE